MKCTERPKLDLVTQKDPFNGMNATHVMLTDLVD